MVVLGELGEGSGGFDRDLAVANEVLDRGGEMQEESTVGDPGVGLLVALGHRASASERDGERVDGEGFLDRVEVLTLDVLGDDQVEEAFTGRGHVVVDDGLERRQPHESGGPQATFATDQDHVDVPDLGLPFRPQIQVGDSRHDGQRLDLPLPKALTEGPQIVLAAEPRARVHQVRGDPRQGDLQ